ncbi:MAG: hypothetical protein ACPG5T_04395, partial [Endozoicomonas sp.]
ILLNHHLQQNTRGVSEISEDTRNWLEVVIASTIGRECSNCNSVKIHSAAERSSFALKQLLSQYRHIPEATARQIAEAAAGVASPRGEVHRYGNPAEAAAGVASPEPAAALLTDIMDDVETLESLRFNTSFDATSLKCYRKTDNKDVQKNICQVCIEYVKYLQTQSCLRGARPLYKQPSTPFKLLPHGDTGIKPQYSQEAITLLEQSPSIYSDCVNALPDDSQLKALFDWEG